MSHSLYKLLLLFAGVYLNICFVQAKCVMRDSCSNDTSSQKPIPCVYDGPPLPLKDSAAIKTLENLCPALNIDASDLTCCTADQVSVFKKQLDQLATLFQRCPSCYQNVANVFCQMVCSPNQTDFLKVTETNKTTGGKVYVEKLSYFITEKYAQGLFKSCENVRLSYTAMRAMVISCGGYGDKCSPHLWLKYMGGKPPSPFETDFSFEVTDNVTVNGTTFLPMNNTIYPCNVAPKEGSTSCSCVDCPCAPIPLPPPEKPFSIMNMPGMYVIMMIVFIIICVIIIGGFTYAHCAKKRDDEDVLLLGAEEEKIYENFNCIEHMGEKLEAKLQQFFTSQGKMYATYPITFLFLGLLFVAIASLGLLFFTVRTNPVELWSAPTSEVREEKNYFDSHFGPFYRTEQVIITRNNGTPVHGTNLTYSSVFDRDFLHQILDLQTKIVELTGERNNQTIHFKDICYAPVNKGSCMIQSVVSWFQSNASHLDYYTDIDDYLTFIQNCTSNPLFVQDVQDGLSCLGDYGGPVFPYVALGGVGDGNYNNATALIVTFMVNNHVRDEDNAERTQQI